MKIKEEYRIVALVTALVWGYLGVLLLVGVLAGCTTVRDQRSFVVQPSSQPTVVTTWAKSDCSAVFFVVSCALQMEQRASDGQRGVAVAPW